MSVNFRFVLDNKRTIVYYIAMRIKDDEKRRALIRATVHLVNRVGFASCSVSKIAREAGVSASTLYIYFENKEHLIVSAYIDLKLEIGRIMLEGFNQGLPLRESFRTSCRNYYDYVMTHPEEAAFAEQFSSSPYAAQVNMEELEEGYRPLFAILREGIRKKQIKDVPLEVIGICIFTPIAKLARYSCCIPGCSGKGLEFMDIVFDMAWDAIKL